MKRHSFGQMNCSLAQSLELIGEWWTLLIIREAMWGTSRFDDFHLRLGIARNVLTARLVKLEEAGILLRHVSAENARIFDYKLTTQGWDLFTTVVALMQWGDRWIYQKRGAPIEFFDAKSGLPIQQLAIRNSAGRTLDTDSIEIRAGPGADKATIRRASGKPTKPIDK
jgi:DNA-binding HxlR family transcriptional regulator